MNIGLKNIVTAGIVAIAAYAGYHYSQSEVERTCNDEQAPTILNGRIYVCVSLERAQANAVNPQRNNGV